VKISNTVVAVLIAAGLALPHGLAQADTRLRVAVSVASESLEREVLGYARNELRRLGDVEVVDIEEDHFFHLKISHLRSTNRLGVATGHTISAVLVWVPGQEMLGNGTLPTGSRIFAGHYVHVGGPNDLRRLTDALIRNADTGPMEDERRRRRTSRGAAD